MNRKNILNFKGVICIWLPARDRYTVLLTQRVQKYFIFSDFPCIKSI